MKIIWSSTTPQVATGYGVQAKELIRRLRAGGHFVRVATKHFYPSWCVLEDGLEVFEGNDLFLLNQMATEEAFDLIFTHWDIWLIDGKRPIDPDKWAAYIPIDTEWISEPLANVSKNVRWPIAMSRHGERELRSIGLDPMFAPHGIDATGTFFPDPESGAVIRREFGWTDDHFVIGAVGLNYADDRKGLIPLMRAFKHFRSRHPEARLYLHTKANERNQPNEVHYFAIAANLGISDAVAWPHQLTYQVGRIGAGWLNEIYNSFDVFCLPTRGEGFGIPIVEAQAAGIPVITTATTTGPELTAPDGGFLIPVSENDLRWLGTRTWRHEVGHEPILECLETAFEAWRTRGASPSSEWWERKRASRVFAGRFDWEHVWPTYWVPIFERLKAEIGPRKA